MFDFLSEKFSSIFNSITGKDKELTTDAIETALVKIKEALLDSDVPYNVVESFAVSIQQGLVGKKLQKSLSAQEQVIKVVHEKLLEFLGGTSQVAFSFQLPSVVMVMGLQGSGKTTTIGKLARFVIKEAQKRNKVRSILLASVDFYRPAAIHQLELLARQVKCSFYKATSTDPVVAAREIFDEYKRGKYELLFLDTAGRMHVDERLMLELQEIDRVVNPRYKILVLDSMTGQESLRIAQQFDAKVGFQSAILTKMDSDTRGGAAFAFRYVIKKPIVFAGFGEKIDDLQLFFPDRIAQRMLSMGDVQTLLEHANEKIKQSDQNKVYSSFMSGTFTLEDFAQQMDMVSQLGSLAQIAKYLPKMGGLAISQQELQKGEQEMKKFRAIICSMTQKERLKPHLIDDMRKARIAKGSGVVPQDVTILLQRFEQAEQYVKMYKKSGPLKGLFR